MCCYFGPLKSVNHNESFHLTVKGDFLSACTKTLPMDSILVAYSGMISDLPTDAYCYFKDLLSGTVHTY